MLILLILAQLSTFTRLPMPAGREWVQQKKEPVICKGDFVMPATGYTVRYRDLHPADYNSKKFPVVPQFCDHKGCDGGNQEPIYDIDESYDHITVKAKPGTHWWYTITIAVPKEDKK